MPGSASFSPFVRTTWSSIGLGAVFSLRRVPPPLPSTLSSRGTRRWGCVHPYGTGTLLGVGFNPSSGLGHPPSPHNAHRFEVGLLLDRSPLIKESRLVSSPGRTDMLKFHPSSSSEWGGSSSHSPSFNPSNNPVRRSPHHPDDPFEDRCHVLGPHRVSSSATSFIVPRAKASTGSRHLIAFILVPSLSMDPSAGSPTDTLLRLLLPPSLAVRPCSVHPSQELARRPSR